ncbi:hypothetical protein KGA66_08135 [Actinocrinis puniceicyclus]|uniref:Uncharacterized protein n=1 Tax=Actinocrinis puniceicyclus TaxID=977794 RepID=A0A8J8BDP8_9ACTN|nr:hypothetical protein [Actinocrinis puniceicyclus]MBS2963009.1 hypothetical protein [Actinocrinis puniceicyclus]
MSGPSVEPRRPADQDATRYLCAAAHVDPEFARDAVRELLVAEHRLPVAQPEIDLPTVLRHCIAARSRRLYRDAAIVVVLALAAVTAGWSLAAWYVALAGLWLILRAGRRPAAPLVRNLGLLAALLWAFAGAVLLTLTVTDSDPFGLRTAWHLHPPSDTDIALRLGAPAAAALCCWLTVLAEEIAAYVTVAERLRRDRFTPGRWLSAEPAWAQHALGVLGRRLADGRLEQHPVADPANPFLGSGAQRLRRRWLIELGPAASRGAPFDVADLLDRVCERLTEGLGSLDPADPAQKSGTVVVDDFAVSTVPALATGLGDDEVRLLPDVPDASLRGAGPRVFRRIRIGDDPAGLTVTGYINATAGAGLLQVELYGHVLGPVAQRYRVPDRTAPFDAVSALACAQRAARRLPATVFKAPRGLLSTAAEPACRRRNRAMLARAAACGLTVTAGARYDLREAAAAEPGADRFADEDANLYLAVIERRVREELRPLLPVGRADF